jgi:hypothetical protein
MFDVEDHGSIVLIRPLTSDVKAWLEANVNPDAQWFGRALVIEHRYAEDLALALINEGFAAQ